MFKYNFNLPSNSVRTVAASRANEITKEYYWFLVGEINRGTIQRAVCRRENLKFGVTSYHLISI